MATIWTLTSVLWLYTLTSHLQLFAASDIITDRHKLQDEIKRPRPVAYDFNTNISWDYLVFAVQWPQSVCTDFKDQYNLTCQVPTNVNKWTIHGLWPSKFNNEDIFNCNTSYPFDPTQVKDLLNELETDWPNLNSSVRNDTEFWAHEWDKHGTCAVILPELAGEHNYFQRTMQLLEALQFDKIFEAAKLVPSKSQNYKAADFIFAINETLKVNPVPSCYTTIHTQPAVTYLQQLEICVDKEFNPINCPSTVLGNCSDRNLLYPPISHDSRENPF